METTILQHISTYLLAILLGALMGLERERKPKHLAGLRTFILVTLFGAICGQISLVGENRWVIWAGILAVTIQTVTAHYFRAREEVSQGLTTSFALLVAYVIGVLVTLGQAEIAVALSLATTVILYFKPQLHDFTRRLSDRDIYAIFQFGLITFVVLPILPDRGFGPYQALNPYNIWLMVVMISAINLVGYVLLKIFGQRWTGPLIGILGGTISSTATTLSFSRQVKHQPALSLLGALVVSLASTVVLVRIAFLVGVIHIELLPQLALPLGAMLVGGLVPALLVWKKASAQPAPPLETRNPMELKQALLFGLLYAVILLAVSAAKDLLGERGVYLVSLVSGLTDVDAITLSNARLAGRGELAEIQAAVSILIAYLSNLVFKLGIVALLAPRKMFFWALVCFICLGLPALLVFSQGWLL